MAAACDASAPTFLWEGQGIEADKCMYYKAFKLSGVTYSQGDHVYLLPEVDGVPPYLARCAARASKGAGRVPWQRGVGVGLLDACSSRLGRGRGGCISQVRPPAASNSSRSGPACLLGDVPWAPRQHPAGAARRLLSAWEDTTADGANEDTTADSANERLWIEVCGGHCIIEVGSDAGAVQVCRGVKGGCKPSRHKRLAGGRA
jgi:hypothetical protein